MLSENLKNLRKAKGFSQEELAARLHVVRQTVSKWEKGRSVPDAELLVRLAEELDATLAELLGPQVPPGGGRHGGAAGPRRSPKPPAPDTPPFVLQHTMPAVKAQWRAPAVGRCSLFIPPRPA